MSDREKKNNFCSKLSLNLFRATIANPDTRSLKSLHTFFDTYLGHMLAKFEPNRRVRKEQNLELFDKKGRKKEKKRRFLKTTFDKVLTPFCKTFLKRLFNSKLLSSDFYASVFLKLWYSDKCN